jgi:hypothetical protein
MKSFLSRRFCWLSLIWLSILALSTVAIAQVEPDECFSHARTPMEKTYCQVAKISPQAGLPSLFEFRRNPEKTQRLLLRHPAAKAGITLPPPNSQPASLPNSSTTPAPAAKSLKTNPQRTPAIAQSTPSPKVALSNQHLMSICQLSGEQIRCGEILFRLQGNLPNNRLTPGALDPHNKIQFLPFRGDTQNILPYLTQLYQSYIESMLTIGLGGSTMSFTKFHRSFLEAQTKGTQFGERLTTMFEFLKRDKQKLGVQARYNNQLPQNIALCSNLSDHLIVCDNVQQNWIYQRVKP